MARAARQARIFVLCNSSGPVAVYDNESAAYAMLAKVENHPRQQNNSIDEFEINRDPVKRELLD